MKKSHKYEDMEGLEVRCPHCQSYNEHRGLFFVGYKLKCPCCLRKFELGRRK